MAVTYGFYNSLNKDRVYNAEQISSIFDGVITDGVFASIGDTLATVPGTGMQVVVKTGKCWFNGTWTINDSLLPLDIEVADVNLSRIDAVVVEVNATVAVRKNSIKIIKGAASANPTNPVMKSGESIYQYPIAYVRVDAGVTSITADKISINVGRGTCPFVTSILQQTNINDLFNQWDTEFKIWFDNLKTQLSGDVAVNLQRQINEMLPDSMTRDILKLGPNATTNDAWQALAIGVGKKMVKVKVIDYDGSSKAGVSISGLSKLDGYNLVTDSNGIAYGSGSGQVTISISINGTVIDSKTISIGDAIVTECTFQLYKATVTILMHDNSKPVDGCTVTINNSFLIKATSNVYEVYLKNPSIGKKYSVTCSNGGYLDLETKTLSISVSGINNQYTLKFDLRRATKYESFTSSQTIKLSKLVSKYKGILIGGGQGGGGGSFFSGNHSSGYGGCGGNGGQIVHTPDIQTNGAAVSVKITIGAGGAGGKKGSIPTGGSPLTGPTGGTTTMGSYSASGGSGSGPTGGGRCRYDDDDNRVTGVKPGNGSWQTININGTTIQVAASGGGGGSGSDWPTPNQAMLQYINGGTGPSGNSGGIGCRWETPGESGSSAHGIGCGGGGGGGGLVDHAVGGDGGQGSSGGVYVIWE